MTEHVHDDEGLMERCPVCHGRGKVTLPWYSDVASSVVDAELSPLSMSIARRDYACPECHGGRTSPVDLDRVAILTAGAELETDDHLWAQQDYRDHVRRLISRRLADVLLDGHYISFTRGKADPKMHRMRYRGTIGVVAPGVVATIEQRIGERQGDVAREVADEARQLISNWNSDFTGDGGSIRKDHAMSEVGRAFRAVVERRLEATRELLEATRRG